MQTFHLRFRDLRAISLRQGLSRWRTPSGAMRTGMKGPPGLSNSQGPSCADGSRPASRHLVGILCPVAGAGLPRVTRVRVARIVRLVGADPCRVCRWQTAREPVPDPARQEAGDRGTAHGQARASAVRCTPSAGLSFPLRPQRCGAGAPPVQQRNAPPERFQEAASPIGKKTVARWSRVSGYLGSGDAGVRTTRRLLSSAGEEGAWRATTSP